MQAMGLDLHCSRLAKDAQPGRSSKHLICGDAQKLARQGGLMGLCCAGACGGVHGSHALRDAAQGHGRDGPVHQRAHLQPGQCPVPAARLRGDRDHPAQLGVAQPGQVLPGLACCSLLPRRGRCNCHAWLPRLAHRARTRHSGTCFAMTICYAQQQRNVPPLWLACQGDCQYARMAIPALSVWGPSRTQF